MRYRKFQAMLVSRIRAAIARFRSNWWKRRAETGLKDLSQHLLKDIGQDEYHDRRTFERKRTANSMHRFGL